MDTNNAKFQVNLFHRLTTNGLFISGLPLKIGKKSKWSYYVFTFFISLFLILGSTVTLINTSDRMYKLQATIRFFLSIMISSVFLCSYFNRNEIKKFFAKFDKDSPTFIGDEEMKATAIEFLKIAKHEGMIFAGLMIGGQIDGIVETFLGEKMYDYFYLYSCGSTEEQTTIEFCFAETSLIFFITNEVLVFVIVIYQGFIAQVAQLLIFAALESMNAKLRRYDELLSECKNKIENMNKFDMNDRLEFATIIKYQQNIIRHKQAVKSVSHMPVVMHVISFYIMNTCIFVSVGSKEFESVHLTLALIMMSCYSVYLHYTLCNHWQAINSSHEHFSDTLLQLPWYERNLKFQKFYLMALQLNQKGDPISLFGLYEVNLAFFAANMNRVYSMVNLLLLKYRS